MNHPKSKIENQKSNVIVAGVGGQGVLLISELLARAAIAAGCDAKQTEIHGVSQRGGSVYSHVRFGARVYSPLISPGQADIILGLEKLEALRFVTYLKPDGLFIINDYEVIPRSAGSAANHYPHQAIDYLKGKGVRVVDLPATKMATTELSNVRLANTILLGALSYYLSLPEPIWEEIFKQRLPGHALTANRRSFALGRALANEHEGVREKP